MPDRFIEGPGIIIEPAEDVSATDGPAFIIAIDEEYITELLGAKYGLDIKPRG